jgi:aryl-alcohol dehydrogenase-like predicted oxidoreductase
MLTAQAEKELLPYCGQQKIGVVCYSPMYKGLLTGKFTAERAANLGESDHRSRDAQFQKPIIDAHLGLVECLKPIAEGHGRSLAELAIAWVLRRSEVTSAIVGSRRPEQVKETVAAADWTLCEADIQTIDQLLAGHQQALRIGLTAEF